MSDRKNSAQKSNAAEAIEINDSPILQQQKIQTSSQKLVMSRGAAKAGQHEVYEEEKADAYQPPKENQNPLLARSLGDIIEYGFKSDATLASKQNEAWMTVYHRLVSQCQGLPIGSFTFDMMMHFIKATNYFKLGVEDDQTLLNFCNVEHRRKEEFELLKETFKIVMPEIIQSAHRLDAYLQKAPPVNKWEPLISSKIKGVSKDGNIPEDTYKVKPAGDILIQDGSQLAPASVKHRTGGSHQPKPEGDIELLEEITQKKIVVTPAHQLILEQPRDVTPEQQQQQQEQSLDQGEGAGAVSVEQAPIDNQPTQSQASVGNKGKGNAKGKSKTLKNKGKAGRGKKGSTKKKRQRMIDVDSEPDQDDNLHSKGDPESSYVPNTPNSGESSSEEEENEEEQKKEKKFDTTIKGLLKDYEAKKLKADDSFIAQQEQNKRTSANDILLRYANLEKDLKVSIQRLVVEKISGKEGTFMKLLHEEYWSKDREKIVKMLEQKQTYQLQKYFEPLSAEISLQLILTLLATQNQLFDQAEFLRETIPGLLNIIQDYDFLMAVDGAQQSLGMHVGTLMNKYAQYLRAYPTQLSVNFLKFCQHFNTYSCFIEILNEAQWRNFILDKKQVETAYHNKRMLESFLLMEQGLSIKSYYVIQKDPHQFLLPNLFPFLLRRAPNEQEDLCKIINSLAPIRMDPSTEQIAKLTDCLQKKPTLSRIFIKRMPNQVHFDDWLYILNFYAGKDLSESHIIAMLKKYESVDWAKQIRNEGTGVVDSYAGEARFGQSEFNREIKKYASSHAASQSDLKKITDELQEIVDHVVKMSNEWDQQSSGYTHDYYQVYVTVLILHMRLCRSQEKQVFTLPTASGKTYILGLLKMFFAKVCLLLDGPNVFYKPKIAVEEENAQMACSSNDDVNSVGDSDDEFALKILILVPNTDLKDQMKTQLGSVQKIPGLVMTFQEALSKGGAFLRRQDLILVDEVDQLLKAHSYEVVFDSYAKGYSLVGMWNFSFLPFIGTTATLSKLTENNIQRGFFSNEGETYKDWLCDFESEMFVQRGVKNTSCERYYLLEQKGNDKGRTAVDIGLMQILQFYNKQPLIVYATDAQREELIAKIDHLNAKNLEQHLVIMAMYTTKDILSLRCEDRGIVFQDPSQYSGVNIRLAVPSRVVVLCYVQSASHEQQFQGRSNRERGICEAYIVVADETRQEYEDRLMKVDYEAIGDSYKVLKLLVMYADKQEKFRISKKDILERMKAITKECKALLFLKKTGGLELLKTYEDYKFCVDRAILWANMHDLHFSLEENNAPEAKEKHQVVGKMETKKAPAKKRQKEESKGDEEDAEMEDEDSEGEGDDENIDEEGNPDEEQEDDDEVEDEEDDADQTDSEDIDEEEEQEELPSKKKKGQQKSVVIEISKKKLGKSKVKVDVKQPKIPFAKAAGEGGAQEKERKTPKVEAKAEKPVQGKRSARSTPKGTKAMVVVEKNTKRGKKETEKKQVKKMEEAEKDKIATKAEKDAAKAMKEGDKKKLKTVALPQRETRQRNIK